MLDQRGMIESAAIETARSFNQTLALLLYDVTTLYFETHKPDDDLQARGFSKDDKSKQPQIVVGLLVTGQGFPLIHEVFKENTFEGHTMLSAVTTFQKRYKTERPIIVADSAMLSQTNRDVLERECLFQSIRSTIPVEIDQGFQFNSINDSSINSIGDSARNRSRIGA